ncbi:MAG TPA: hypothetical protein VK913_11635, partial [Erythrobacter sp.]|nr:hypothetical protein [Erythrobacter sp.]
MSAEDIFAAGPLARVLADYPVPALSAGFADRVMAAAEARSAPPPVLRRMSGRSGHGWRMGRRIAVGATCFAALATAAAATGLLE